jgi:hypothetical protein
MQRLRVEFQPSANVDMATIFEYIFWASRPKESDEVEDRD